MAAFINVSLVCFAKTNFESFLIAWKCKSTIMYLDFQVTSSLMLSASNFDYELPAFAPSLLDRSSYAFVDFSQYRVIDSASASGINARQTSLSTQSINCRFNSQKLTNSHWHRRRHRHSQSQFCHPPAAPLFRCFCYLCIVFGLCFFVLTSAI